MPSSLTKRNTNLTTGIAKPQTISSACISSNNKSTPSIEDNSGFRLGGLGSSTGPAFGLSTLHAIRNSIPAASSFSSVLFELVVFAFSAVVLFLQLLHIYRTVWWRPQSYTQQAVKLYLINPNVVGIFGLVSLPRLLWALLKAFITKFVKIKWQTEVLKTLKITLITTWIILYCFFFTKFLQFPRKDSKWLAVIASCFLYPIVLYVGISRKSSTFTALLEVATDVSTERCPTTNAEEIRQEVKILRKDFNERLKRVLLHSFLVTYTATVLPCILTQNYMVYNVYITTEHVLLTFVGSFTLNAVYAFPLKYCSSLHNVAKYLGSWSPVSNPENGAEATTWCPKTIYFKDNVVNFNGLICRAGSDWNAGTPGNRDDLRFFIFFGKNGLFQALLLVLQLLLVVVQFVLLLRSTEWHQMISLTFIQAMACFPLFHLVRDGIITRRMELGAGLLLSRNLCN